MTKWSHILFVSGNFLISIAKLKNICKRSFLIRGKEQFVTKWLNLWPNENTFHFSEGIFLFYWWNVDTFVKEVLLLKVRNRLWWNELICDEMTAPFISLRAFSYSIDRTKWTTISFFWGHFCIQLIKCRHFSKWSFLIGGQEQVVTKWFNLWRNEHPIYFNKGIFVFNRSNRETFVKEVFLFEVRNRLWQNDLLWDQRNINISFLRAFSYSMI